MISKARPLSVLAISAFFALAGHASPSDASGSKRNAIFFVETSGNMVRVENGPIEGTRPSCHKAGGIGFAFDHTTNQGKTLMSIIHAAFLAGNRVTLYGTSTSTDCVTYGGTAMERLTGIRLEPN